MKFLGHIIDSSGVRADLDKTKAICEMDIPGSVSDLHRFLETVHQLGKFSPNIAELTQPLLSTKHAWLWGSQQENAFNQIKEELTKLTTLVMYDPNAEVKISADASSFWLGTVLLLKSDGGWKPVPMPRD